MELRNASERSALHCVPKFYFDVCQDGQLYSDEDGQELADIDAAEIEAAEAGAAIARDVFPKKRGGELVIQVRDQNRQHLTTVSVDLRIARIPP
jgi:hypothetical protein